MTDGAARGSRLSAIAFGILFALSLLALVWSLAATPSPGLPPAGVGLFHNQAVAWVAVIGLVVSLAGALIAAAAGRNDEQRGRIGAAAEAERLQEQVGELEAELERRARALQETRTALEEARRELDTQVAAEAGLRSANEGLERGRREHELRIRELELRIGELELERERQRPLQQA